MGIEMPEENPQLDPLQGYAIVVPSYWLANCVGYRGDAVGVVSGAAINAFYAAGGDCVLNNKILPLVEGLTQRISHIEDPP